MKKLGAGMFLSGMVAGMTTLCLLENKQRKSIMEMMVDVKDSIDNMLE